MQSLTLAGGGRDARWYPVCGRPDSTVSPFRLYSSLVALLHPSQFLHPHTTNTSNPHPSPLPLPLPFLLPSTRRPRPTPPTPSPLTLTPCSLPHRPTPLFSRYPRPLPSPILTTVRTHDDHRGQPHPQHPRTPRSGTRRGRNRPRPPDLLPLPAPSRRRCHNLRPRRRCPAAPRPLVPLARHEGARVAAARVRFSVIFFSYFSKLRTLLPWDRIAVNR